MKRLVLSADVQSATSSLSQQFERIDISQNSVIARGEGAGGPAGRSNHKDDLAKRGK